MSLHTKAFFQDSLYYNSLFLILSTGAMAGFGFIFWLLNSKLFSANDLGIATALIPIANIIALGSLFGLDASIIRFLPTHQNAKQVVRSSLLAVTFFSVFFGILFGVSAQLHSPSLVDFFSETLHYIVFLALIVSTALNLICDAIYLSRKKSFFTLVVTIVYSALKATFPLLFVDFGSTGILIAAASAQCIGLLINFIILQLKWSYFTGFNVSISTLTETWKYTFSNYIATIFNLLPASIIPLIIINKIGVAEAAYYYIVMMIVNLLYVVSYATTKSLFAEGSHTTEHLIKKIKQTIFFIFAITLPSVSILWFFSSEILSFFGSDYSTNGAYLLQIAGITAIPMSIVAVCAAIFRIRKNTLVLITCNLIQAVLVISLTILYSTKGLNGVGQAWLTAYTITAVIATTLVFFLSKEKS